MRVLLVEDDAMIAQAVSANLKDAGYAVDWVSRGSEVAAAVAAQAYDLLLLDLGLPGKDGLDVLAQIRNGGCTVPVLIVTARDDLHSRLNGLDGGADDYIVKPFDMAELQARMRAVLRRHGGQAQTLLTNGIITLNPSGSGWTRAGRHAQQQRICRPPSPAAASGHDSVAQRFGRQNLRLGRRSRKQRR